MTTPDAPTLCDIMPSDAASINSIFAYCRSAATELIARTTIELLNNDPHADISHHAIARSISADQLESAASIYDASYSPDPDEQLIYSYITLILCDRLNCTTDDICADY